MADSRRRGLALALTTAALFSGSFVAGKVIAHELGPLTASFLRYLLASGLLAVMTMLLRPDGRALSWRERASVVAAGALGVAGYHYFFFLSLHFTSPTHSALINALSPLATGALAAVVLSERLGRTAYVGIIVAVAGAAVLITRGDVDAVMTNGMNQGELLMLAAVACWACYSLLIKQLLTSLDGLTVTLHVAVSGTLILAMLAISVEDVGRQLASISHASILSVLYMGLGASGLGYWSYTASIKHLGPTLAASIVYPCVPMFVAVLAAVILAEPITSIMILSAVLIVAGLVLTLRK